MRDSRSRGDGPRRRGVARKSESRGANARAADAPVADAGVADVYDTSVRVQPADVAVDPAADPAANVAADAAPVALTADAIRVRAYELYLERGAEPGHDVEDWLAAERALRGDGAAAPRPAS